MTFNEEVTDIDPAFLRPGRCVANVRFPLMPRAAAAEWLKARGKGAEAEGLAEEVSLADLYAKASGGPIVEGVEETVKGPAVNGGTRS